MSLPLALPGRERWLARRRYAATCVTGFGRGGSDRLGVQRFRRQPDNKSHRAIQLSLWSLCIHGTKKLSWPYLSCLSHATLRLYTVDTSLLGTLVPFRIPNGYENHDSLLRILQRPKTLLRDGICLGTANVGAPSVCLICLRLKSSTIF